MKAIFVCINLLLLFYCHSATAQASGKKLLKNIDCIIQQKMAETGVVGLGAAIIINKKLVWQNVYGFADRENKKPFTPETIMNIASVSKTITGACIMKAVEQKKLNLDEDINNYLPFKIVNPYFPDEKITLRMLATHTSSLVDRYPFYTDSTYFNDKDSPEPLGDFLKDYFVGGGKHYSKENFLNHKPGTWRDYSNIGAGLGGYIVELRTGKKLDKFSSEYIFNPLKMENTGWFLSEINTNRHSKLYVKQGDGINQIPLYGTTTYPDGGVRTSVLELSRFFISLLNDGQYNGVRILKKELAKQMLQFQFTPQHKPDNVDLTNLNSGVFWATKMGGTRIGHNGSDPGVRTFMLSDLAKKIGIILFINTSLSEKEENVYFDMYSEFYKYAKTLEK